MSLVKSDSRINFGIDYYDNEAEADAVGAMLVELREINDAPPDTKWGQHFGRDKTWDHDGLFAVVVP